MAKKSFEARMADLEKAQGVPEKIVEEAASILGLDLEATIARCAIEPLYKASSDSHGFKEQWVLRWLLKKLAVTDKSKNGNGKVGDAQRSFIICPKFWSLLLNLTCSVPGDICSGILLERDFHPLLVDFIREILRMEASRVIAVGETDDDREVDGPPAKRRRLSPLSTSRTAAPPQEKLQWAALQAGCRCAHLSNMLSSPSRVGTRTSSAKTATWNDQAALLGTLLELVACVTNSSTETAGPDFVSGILETLLSAWSGVAPTIQKKGDGQDPAFSSHCLIPCLHLLHILAGPQLSYRSFDRSRTALERLLALHVVFPLRTIFNEQFTKKWRATAEVLLFEQIETLLKAYSNLLPPIASGPSQQLEDVGAPSIQELSWIILDIAARSMPFSDFRRRQLEQPYVDSLFIWLAHISWPHIPHITSTGVLQQPLPIGSTPGREHKWVSSFERLVDVAHARKLQLSPQIIAYILRTVLSMDTKSAPWSLVVKIISLDVNILVSNSGLSTSEDFLDQLLERIESSTVSQCAYALVRDQIVRPLLRGFGRSRDLDSFITSWQRMLADTMRVRYSLSRDREDIPAVLAWEDEDVFDEFKTLLAVYAPPNMGQRMLKSLAEPIEKIGEKIGSTADVFARLAVFCAILESTLSEPRNIGFDHQQLAGLLLGAMNALSRNSDYQGQRWRLRKLIGLLVELMGMKALPVNFDSLLESTYHFVSLKDIPKSNESVTNRQVAMYLECLECFSLLVQLAAKSSQYQPRLEAEMSHLADLMDNLDGYCVTLWDGRTSNCDSVHKLVAACVGRLLQRSETISMYPESFKAFIHACLENVFRSLPPDSAVDSSPELRDLLLAVLQVEQISRAPDLQLLIFEYVDKNLWSTSRRRKICLSLLHYLSMDTMSKPAIKGFVTSTLRHLFEEREHAKMEVVSDDLCLLAHLDSTFHGAFIDCRYWRNWIDFAAEVLDWKYRESSQTTVMNNPTYASSYMMVVRMMDRVFQTIAARALTVSKPTTTEILAYMVATVQKLETGGEDCVPLSCLRIFLDCSYQLGSAMDSSDQHKDVGFLQTFLARRVKAESGQALADIPNHANLHRLQLIVDAVQCLSKGGLKDELRHITSSIQDKIAHAEGVAGKEYADKQRRRMKLSLRQRIQSTLPEKQHVQELASLITPIDNYTNEGIAALAAEAELFVCQLEPAKWSVALEFLRQKSDQTEYQPACAIILACILVRIKMQDISQYPNLAQGLAEIACVANTSAQVGTTGLFFALENSKAVLHLHPLVVNQSILDRLLASIHAAASAGSHSVRSLKASNSEWEPRSADIYQRICTVIGTILGRHRRRLTDRYHLLLPILQCLLRCLFWPGHKALESQRGPTANAINAFGMSLPKWLHESAEPLPLSSAEQFSRLLSSICNPTVAAARSSSKGGHNELNDAVNRARKLAGQHMQYLVMEYCRCVLDGQISPSMKDHLLPGMYRVMDALDRDVMRAMNAGLDPSSRTIFKGLYDSWSQFGKWDKS
ncbi:uncharacterized protein Z519_06278 [Cladophialophora bantiana CBS 173.52]|uniref:Nucleolar 27S pre-rRNA processing Urb2/Npa2 C-terminal domain-containing protein n=1 Tax=Cladophialophora bantiana (strain ATCC 10958 / CBS 173.52 / CDC B-1940 / NIH 8579) TaxID=1442370 RepID=A0A0D2HK63_CLAB1|nr:uncharacterized protein Z519_06278 [Cladophialophora bantiana CBS 173.52]KIW93673.1 hypothetical protein Z519_06278 [Cladophialophora bantiana CBS 173.52]